MKTDIKVIAIKTLRSNFDFQCILREIPSELAL